MKEILILKRGCYFLSANRETKLKKICYSLLRSVFLSVFDLCDRWMGEGERGIGEGLLAANL